MLKRLVKVAVKPFWKLSSPVRRPIARKLDARLNHMVAVALQTQLMPQLRGSLDASEQSLGRLEASIGHANHSAQALATEMDLMVGSLIREVARLQAQVDTLQDLVEHAVSSGRGLTVVSDDEDGEAPRARVG